MLAAFFDIPSAPAGAGAFGKAGGRAAAPSSSGTKAARKRASKSKPSVPAVPKPADAAPTHAKFEPLPPERGVAPRPAEEPGQAWQALAGSGVTRDDDIAEFRADWWEEEADAAGEEADDVSEPDFEPESLEPFPTEAPAPGDSVASSLDEDVRVFFSKRTRGGAAAPGGRCAGAVYTGPRLCYEDDDWEY